MAANEHRNLLDGNRHYPLGYESGDNNSYLGKGGGATYNDKTGNMVWSHILQTFVLSAEIVRTGIADYIRVPYDFRLTSVRASLYVAGGLISIDLLENGVSILSTALTIDAGEKTSTTAAIPVVISDYELASDSEITVNITGIGEGKSASKIKVYLIGYKTS